MDYKKVISLIIFILALNILLAEINVTPITHFAQAQHYSYEAITISDSLIVCKSVTGIDIYSILSDNNISLVSHLDIINPRKMKVNNNCVYISSWIDEYSITRFSQIDISNISQPEIIQQLDFDYSNRLGVFEIFNSDKLFMYESCIDSSIVIHVYNLPEFEFSNTIELDIGSLYAINDSIGWNYDGAPSYNLRIWDVSDPLSLELIEEVDMTQYHGLGSRPKQFVMYEDSLLAASGITSISFWDISNFTEWEYITQLDYPDGFNENNMCPINVYNNKLITSDNWGFSLYNIEDLDNIELLDFIEGEISNHITMTNTTYFDTRNNFLYATGLKDGVHKYEISVNSINYLGTNLEMPSFLYIIVNGCIIIAHSLDYGIYFFDLSDPENPIIIPDYLSYENSITIFYKNNNLAVSYEIDGNYYFDLYNIADPYDIQLISQYPLELFEFVISSNGNWDEIFIQNFDVNNSYFRKASITQVGNLENIYTYNLPSINFEIKDDYGYYITSNREMFYLEVLTGLNSDYPELINSIEVGNYAAGSIFFTINNSLLQFSTFNEVSTFFYDTINPFEPQFLTSLSLATSSSGLAYQNHYFSANSHTSFIYDLNNPPPVVYPIGQVTSHTNIYRIKEMIINSEEYLIVNNQGSLEVWTLNITQGVEDIIPIPPINIYNYPNPFNPETKIVLDLSEPRQIKLEIYNIKGQKVKTLLDCYIDPGRSETIWNSKDDDGKRVSSGVYFYKLIVNGKTEGTKKMLLLK